MRRFKPPRCRKRTLHNRNVKITLEYIVYNCPSGSLNRSIQHLYELPPVALMWLRGSDIIYVCHPKEAERNYLVVIIILDTENNRLQSNSGGSTNSTKIIN